MVLFSHCGKKMAYTDAGFLRVCSVTPGVSTPEVECSFPLKQRIPLAVSDSGYVALFKKPRTIVVAGPQGETSFAHDRLRLYDLDGISARFSPWPVAKFDNCWVGQIGEEYLVVCCNEFLQIVSPQWAVYGGYNWRSVVSLKDGKEKEVDVVFSCMEVDDSGNFIAAVETNILLLPPVGDLDIGLCILSLPYRIGKMARRGNLLAVWCQNGAMYVVDIGEGTAAEICRGVFGFVWHDDTLVLLQRLHPPVLSFVSKDDLIKSLRIQEK